MILRGGDLLLKRTVQLYNNIARSGDCVGRLHAELQVHPAPRIAWDFESLGDTACKPAESEGRLAQPLVGSWFSIDEPYVGWRSWGTVIGQPRVALRGGAALARYGDSQHRAHSFTFYLPNGRFQQIAIEGQGKLERYLKAESKERSWDRWQGSDGWFVSLPIDSDWSIHLETRQEALSWLAPQERNVGTLITAVGRLYHPMDDEDTPKQWAELPTLSMAEAQERLDTLSPLLSFANGGYLGPLYIEGVRQQGEDLEFSASVLRYKTTPLEQLGVTWLTSGSSLPAYLRCLPTFERMMSAEPWKEVFPLVLIWYFQAIQPQTAQTRGKPWPVVITALCAALERLSHTILREELGIRSGLSNPKQRIQRLIDTIGVRTMRGGPDYLQGLLDLRNAAVHPRPVPSISPDNRGEIIRRAIQWVEEVLLWRLGYNGEYRDSVRPSPIPFEPRYDLNARDPGW